MTISPNRSLKVVSPESALVWAELGSQYDVPNDWNIAVDGDMQLDSTSPYWLVNAGTLAKVSPGHTGTKCIEVTRSSVNCYMYPAPALIVGTTYRVKGWARGDGQGSPSLYESVNLLWAGTTSTSWQYFDVTFTCSGILGWYVIGGNYKIYVDDVSITPVSLLADYDMEAAGVTSWLSGNSATISKQSATPIAGQCIRVTRSSVNNPYAYQSVCVTNANYVISGYARGDGSLAPRIINNSGISIWDGIASTDWQYFNVSFTAPGAIIGLMAPTSTNGPYVEFDNVVLIQKKRVCDNLAKYPGAPRYLTLGDGVTSTTFPTQLIGKHGMSFDGGDYIDTGIVDSFEINSKFTLFIATAGAQACCFGNYNVPAYGYGLNDLAGGGILYGHLYSSIPNLVRVYTSRQGSGIRTAAMTYNGNLVYQGINLFLDGFAAPITVAASATLTGTLKNGKSILIGTLHNNATKTQFFTGQVFFAAVFPFDLTNQQVQYLDKLVRSRFTKP